MAKRIQHKRLTFDVITRAEEPLVIPEHVMERLRAALESAVASNVDLTYHPQGDRYMDARHEFIGVDGPDE